MQMMKSNFLGQNLIWLKSTKTWFLWIIKIGADFGEKSIPHFMDFG